ncbi:Hypothetical secreted protein [Ectocarpus siliculosus]|uniref:Hypothetical secreted protein n=1 Tax=Ectocarpus siliculosus TaxID=2880 RepID=D7FZ13_ECTSI|nr:Hypothetical secreted protein [Ectocarpus siliculosus]|eukprot:CBJ32630.1 Hypothetical secreted protein [Ectocarpus siliculosus]
MQNERRNTGVVSRAAAAVLLVSCLVVGIVIGARGSSSSGNLRAQQYSAASVGSAPSAAGSEDKPAGNLVLPKPLKHTGDEQLAGDIDVGSPAGAWGPDDEEKDDWVNLFGMDGARTREGGASPAGNLPRFIDLMVEDGMSFSFSYDYDGAWFH